VRVCIVGGIYGKPADYQARHVFTPETLLERGLRNAGVSVTTASHQAFVGADDYDVVHVHHIGRAAFEMACRRSRAAFVFTGHDGQMLCGYERSQVRRAAFRYVVRGCNAAVALSPAEARFLEELAGKRPAIHVIPNGIPVDVYASWNHPRPRSTGPHTLLFVGQLIDLKGVDILLRAVASVAREWDIRLVLAYQNGFREDRYRQLSKSLGITHLVRFLGAVPPVDLAVLYRSAAMLVLPSYAESLPSVITEALMSGTPVVATRVGGIPWQLGSFGRLVAPGNVSELRTAIMELLQESVDTAPVEDERRKYAVAKFQLSAMVEAHVRLYEELGRSRRPRRNLGRAVQDLGVQVLASLYWGPSARAVAQ
jgi:glycosyltransferase involved in cell wall biosynthesis